MKIFFIGSDGFIGRYFIVSVIVCGYEVIVLIG